MHYAIIAAGEGSRLREEGVSQPKPLVSIQQQPMIDRLMDIMRRCGAESISVICNAEMTSVQQHLREYMSLHGHEVRMHLVVESTPSSMHSLERLSRVIPDGRVCVTTVDTIFREDDFRAYIQAFSQSECGLFAVTPFVDDEKPLWVGVNASGASDHALQPICGFYDRAELIPAVAQPFVSGGIYGFDTATAWPVLRECLAQGQSRMRNYQRALIAAGVSLHAYVFNQIMDIDHASDIAKAEQWLACPAADSLPSGRALLVRRATPYSPNNVERDAAILAAVGSCLEQSGWGIETVDECALTQMPLEQLNSYTLVLHMARRFDSLHRLSQLSIPVINRPNGVTTLSQSREMTLETLQLAGVNVPRWWAYDAEADDMFQCEPELQALLPGWLKVMRTDGVRPDDVQWMDHPLAVDTRIIELQAECVPDIVLTSHVQGDLLKVYCVATDSDVSLWTTYPQERAYSKFGTAEQHNAPLAYHSFEQADLQRVALRIAQAFGIRVFGFDAIVTPAHQLVVIDVNDWPSFGICRNQAAQAIAQMAVNTVNK